MERLNLNVPPDVRKRLRSVAQHLGRTESEVARQLLTEALDLAEREEFYRRMAKAYTPVVRDRELAILAAFERLRG